MLGKASEIKHKRIERRPLLSFNLDDHMRHAPLNDLVEDWLQGHPDYQILSITFYTIDKTEVANIIYKEAESNVQAHQETA